MVSSNPLHSRVSSRLFDFPEIQLDRQDVPELPCPSEHSSGMSRSPSGQRQTQLDRFRVDLRRALAAWLPNQLALHRGHPFISGWFDRPCSFAAVALPASASSPDFRRSLSAQRCFSRRFVETQTGRLCNRTPTGSQVLAQLVGGRLIVRILIFPEPLGQLFLLQERFLSTMGRDAGVSSNN